MTLPLGGLTLQDASGKSIKRADKIVGGRAGRRAVPEIGAGPHLLCRRRRLAFAVRALHMARTGYPLHVMHGYRCARARRWNSANSCTGSIPKRCRISRWSSNARRPLLGYAALVLGQLIRRIKPEEVVISALGVREGLLYSMLSRASRKGRADRRRAQNFNVLRSRSPQHGEELVAWTDRFMAFERHRRDRGGATPAPRRVSARRYRLAHASGLSRRAVAQHDLPRRFRGARSSRARLSRARGLFPPCRDHP